MLLYIHVPFCRKKCAYCAFFSQPLPPASGDAQAVVDQYLAFLLRELRIWATRLGPVPVETVFFGGGTPSLLPGRALQTVLAEVRAHFSVPQDAEISVEANPDSALRDGWLQAVREAGVNRLSLGVQSLDEDDLLLLGRPHDGHTARAAVAAARQAGFSNLSLDLMWGLPGRAGPRRQGHWLRQLGLAMELAPEHISAYGLSLEPETSLHAACARGELWLAPEPELAAMYLAGVDLLESGGYRQYEISNFARPGFACCHNLGYWEGKDYLGLGPSAVSTLGAIRRENPKDMAAWESALQRGVPGPEQEILGSQERAKEHLMLRLRMRRGLNLHQWEQATGRDFYREHGPLAAMLQQNNLASLDNGCFCLTRQGMLVSDDIISRFFSSMEKR